MWSRVISNVTGVVYIYWPVAERAANTSQICGWQAKSSGSTHLVVVGRQWVRVCQTKMINAQSIENDCFPPQGVLLCKAGPVVDVCPFVPDFLIILPFFESEPGSTKYEGAIWVWRTDKQTDGQTEQPQHVQRAWQRRIDKNKPRGESRDLCWR